MLGDVEVEDSPAMMGEHDQDEEHALGRFGISRETVRSDMSIPSFRSSPWMLGAPHRGFAAASLATRALISALTGGRPTMDRPEILVQYSRKRRRCQHSTAWKPR